MKIIEQITGPLKKLAKARKLDRSPPVDNNEIFAGETAFSN